MSLICYRDINTLSMEEQIGLDTLFDEKCKISDLLKDKEIGSKKEKRLYTYGIQNRYHINYNYDINTIKEQKNKYKWVLLMDKNRKLLGYLCFEYLTLEMVSDKKYLLVIHDLFISNHVSKHKTVRIDELLYNLMVLSNGEISDIKKVYIVSKYNYRFCNGFNGFGKVINTSIYSYFSDKSSDDLYIKTPNSVVFKF